ncbi:hypothetical protein KHP62_15305 [Rhodobacteraceae bacterium NNCM2]|nr:hypothetical protein [Coraliihabitans acroporae]
METLAAELAGTPLAEVMRTGRWVYAAVNGLHVLGIALLVGAIAALDLRLIGCWPSVPLGPASRLLVPVAGGGLALAVATGSLLFLAGPQDYLRLSLFWAKIALVLTGTAHALWVHASGTLTGTRTAQRRAGVISLTIWLSTLTAGRMLAFVE